MVVEVLSRYQPVPSTTVLLDAIIEEEDRARDAEHVPSGRLSASQLVGCDWAIWAKHLGLPPTSPPTMKARRRWRFGRLTEDFVRDCHRQAGTLLATEVPVVDETLGIGVSGRIDNVIGGSYGGHEWPMSTVQEVKSLTANQASYFFKKNEGARESWQLQIGTYALIVKRRGWNVTSGSLIVPEPKAWVVTAASAESGGEMDFPMLSSWMDDAERRVEELSAILTSEDEPECSCDTMYSGKGTFYCPFAIWSVGADRNNPKGPGPITCCGREGVA